MSGAGLKVYFDLMSQPSRAVYLFVKAANIPFTPKAVALRKGDHLSDDYKKINPFHLVPAIDDNGFKLSESVAILRYLCDKHKVAEHWYPRADLKQRALVDRFMAWQHLNLRLSGSLVMITKVLEPKRTGSPVDAEKLAKFQGELEIVLDKMENIYLRDHLFVGGSDEISIADLLGICELMQPWATGHDVFAGRPKLHAWASRTKQNLGPLFDEAHEHLYKVRKMFVNDAASAKL